MPKYRRPNAKPERNAAIIRAAAEGFALIEIAERYGITPGRVATIVRQERIRQEGIAARAAFVPTGSEAGRVVGGGGGAQQHTAALAADFTRAYLETVRGLDMRDISAPKHPVQIEIDYRRGVVYVHVDGRTVLRICRVQEVELLQHRMTLEHRESRATALAPEPEL
jgi:hypothetical protein